MNPRGDEPITSPGVKVTRTAGGLKVIFYHFELWNFLGGLGGALVFAVLWARERADGAPWDAVEEFIFLGFGVLCVLGTIATLFNRTVLRVGKERVTWRTLGLAVPRLRSVALDRVKKFDVTIHSESKTELREMGPDRHYTDYSWQVVAVVRGGDPVVLVGGLTMREEREAEVLAAALQTFVDS